MPFETQSWSCVTSNVLGWAIQEGHKEGASFGWREQAFLSLRLASHSLTVSLRSRSISMSSGVTKDEFSFDTRLGIYFSVQSARSVTMSHVILGALGIDTPGHPQLVSCLCDSAARIRVGESS
jgi:hypothetical protein